MIIVVLSCCVFFFKQKTAYEMRISDWSSDVCSSDLDGAGYCVVWLPGRHPYQGRCPEFGELADRPRVWIEQQIHIGIFQPQIREGVERLPGLHRLRQKYAVTTDCARACIDVGYHTQFQVRLRLYVLQTPSITCLRSTRRRGVLQDIQASPGESP